MEAAVGTVNKLQDVFHAIGATPIDLPQIIVVGSQSSGKSSVLESIVGRDFLPRGTGVVTRRPLVLQLYNLPPADAKAGDSREWGEFLHRPGDKLYDFADIRQEIIDDTVRVAGPSKNLSSQPIVLKIYSPHVLNLTLVDLPGLTKIPIGDQPSTIGRQTKKLCLEYISNPTALILAVTAANSDIANSDALKLARIVDPEGNRTLGVLTKLDLMDSGTDALDVLQGRVVPLRKGFVGVVNRSQQNIIDGVDMDTARIQERMFFERHPAYRTLASRMGTQYLSRVLNTLLMNHIRDCLPDLKSRISSMLMEVKADMEKLGDPVEVQSDSSQRGLLLALIARFSTNFGNAIDGKVSGSVEKNELFGGARIAYIFSHSFTEKIEGLDPFDGLSDNDIFTAIKNSTGAHGALFVPEGSFEQLVRRQIKRLESPGLECVDFVYEELQRVSYECETVELQRFGKLRERLIDVVHGLLRRAVEPTHTMISNLIAIELAHINTNHPDFIGGARAVQETLDRLERESFRPPALPEESDAVSIDPPTSVDQEVLEAMHVRRDGSPGRAGSASRSPAAASTNGFAHLDGDAGAAAGAGAGAGTGAGAAAGAGGSGSGGRSGPSGGALVTSPPPASNGVGAAGAVLRDDDAGTRWAAARLLGAPSSRHNPVVKLTRVPSTLRTPTVATLERQEYVELCIIKALIASYFNIVRKNFLDLVPKTIMCFLVNHAKDHMQSELTHALYPTAEGGLDELLAETDDVAEQRRACMELQSMLKKALDIVSEVRDVNMFK